MRRFLLVLGSAAILVAGLAAPSVGRDRPFGTARLIAMKLLPAPEQFDIAGGVTDDGRRRPVQQEADREVHVRG